MPLPFRGVLIAGTAVACSCLSPNGRCADVQTCMERQVAAQGIPRGWVCPLCGMAKAPDVQSCDCGDQGAA